MISPLLLRRLGMGVLAPVLALVMAFVIVAIVLQLSGFDAFGVFGRMAQVGFLDKYLIRSLDKAVPYFFAGCAIAVGFRMALFNIGVEGQYRIAALIAAWVGAKLSLPPVLHVLAIVVVAMAVGSAAAAIPAVLKVTRNVNEVVRTIMLNFILGGVGTWLLVSYLRNTSGTGNNTETALIPPSGRMPAADSVLNAIGFQVPPGESVTGLIFVAIALGIVLWVLINKTRFGFGLRASGLNPIAAQASGISSKGMIIKAMLLSGALAGFVGLPELLSNNYKFVSDTFPQQLGFTGIAVALLGRNTPLGIALGAFLFGFLETTTGALQFSANPALKIPTEMALVMQGAILLSVVIAYELVRRFELLLEGRAVAKAAEKLPDPDPEPAGAAA
ncbi:MAG: ral nucleoside transport system permease protein [Cryptosporangiaceae bacterium]|nr:ral nucleoside transport system permease protein [Cryptosporangiaceae bacterium]